MTASGAHKLVQILGGDFCCLNDTVAAVMHFAMKMAKFASQILVAEFPCDFICDY